MSRKLIPEHVELIDDVFKSGGRCYAWSDTCKTCPIRVALGDHSTCRDNIELRKEISRQFINSQLEIEVEKMLTISRL